MATVAIADVVARNWLDEQGPEATAEIVDVGGRAGRVVEVVTEQASDEI